MSALRTLEISRCENPTILRCNPGAHFAPDDDSKNLAKLSFVCSLFYEICQLTFGFGAVAMDLRSIFVLISFWLHSGIHGQQNIANPCDSSFNLGEWAHGQSYILNIQSSNIAFSRSSVSCTVNFEVKYLTPLQNYERLYDVGKGLRVV